MIGDPACLLLCLCPATSLKTSGSPIWLSSLVLVRRDVSGVGFACGTFGNLEEKFVIKEG